VNGLHLIDDLAVDGVVIAVEKKLPELTDGESVKLIEMLTDHIGVTYAGMGPDFRLLVRLGRAKAQEYQRWFKEPISVLMMVKEMANIMQEYTQSGYATWMLMGNTCKLMFVLFVLFLLCIAYSAIFGFILLPYLFASSLAVACVRSASPSSSLASTMCAALSSSRWTPLAPTSRGRRPALDAACHPPRAP
jgi:hypothetical protein